MNKKQQIVKDFEDSGRLTFSGYCQEQPWCRIHKWSTKEFDHWDVAYLNQDQQLIGEIKQRDYKSDEFGDWWIEADKARLMLNLADKSTTKSKNNTLVSYINIFKDGIIAIWQLTKEQIEQLPSSFRMLPESQYSQKLVNKEVKHLKLSQATIINKINGK